MAVLDRIKHEPAILIGLALSVLVVVVQVIQGELTLEAAVPLVTGFVTRFFVSPSTPG